MAALGGWHGHPGTISWVDSRGGLSPGSGRPPQPLRMGEALHGLSGDPMGQIAGSLLSPRTIRRSVPMN